MTWANTRGPVAGYCLLPSPILRVNLSFIVPQHITKILLCLALLTGGVPVRGGIYEPWVVQLNGPWKFHVGDNAKWAAPNFDDSTWETVDLTPPAGAHDGDVGLSGYVPGWAARGHPGYTGYAWYRLRVELPASDADAGHILLGGPAALDDAYQLFVEGALVGGSGHISSATPVVYSVRPSLVDLSATPQVGTSSRARSVVVAVRVWVEPGALAPDGGGIHVAPYIGTEAAVRERYRRQWNETIRGYALEVIIPVFFLLLAIIALVRAPSSGEPGALRWLALALVLTAALRANQASYFWFGFETRHMFDVVRNVVLTPLVLGAWTMMWRRWFQRTPRVWFAVVVTVLTASYVASQLVIRSWIVPAFPHTLVPDILAAERVVRLAFVALLIGVVYAGIRARGREAWLATACVALVSIGLFAAELSMLGIQGIWFPFGTGVSRTQFTYAAFCITLFVLLRRSATPAGTSS